MSESDIKQDKGPVPGPEMPTVYDPKTVESKWYQYWEEHKCFHAEVEPGKPMFSIVIPPPNVTGSLHMGHAMQHALHDVLVRWRRMQGYNALWLPGTDHAGIATQIKVEERLRKEEGLSRHELGREKFLERVWAWKEFYHDNITGQMKKLGDSVDWERERFTMDEGCSRAVREAFVRLYEKGLIYQGTYIVSWCWHCHTTLSDLEVEHEEETGHLWHLKYPYADGSGYAVVATTRPETMLGDTAVAVHPDDERYQHLVGKTVILPIMNREIPIVADAYVDPTFGTGMVKVTPSHDPNDFEIGLRHQLKQIQVIGEDGNMTAAAGAYAGMSALECRKRLVAELEQQGLLLRVEEHVHAVGHCQRCGTAVEPLVSKQWFVRMQPLAKPAIAAVKSGDIRFVPDRFSKNYLHWMENIRDWCISRQLWWGHRIPVWTCQDCNYQFAAKVDPQVCPKCNSARLEQDPDVLDTWFSSALWPFSTLGWPDKTPELDYFYPTTVLITAYDIIYFWVARMIFSGLEYMDQRPFADVLVHGLVRNAEGKKMSKSLGTGVDPLELIDAFGADALRLTLITGVAPGNDTRYHPERVESTRNFLNKMWNAARFALMNLRDFALPTSVSTTFATSAVDFSELALELPDRWILSRLGNVADEVGRHLERYDVGEGSRVLYDFTWTELCDWYIEMVKPRLYGHQGAESRQAAQTVLWHVLRSTMELLHPYVPFITEEIWQHLPHAGDTIMLAPWPVGEPTMRNADAEADMSMVMEVIRAIRNVRAEKTVPPQRQITAIMHAGPEKQAILQQTSAIIKSLAKVNELEICAQDEVKPEKALAVVAGGVEVFLPLAGLVDVAEELERLRKALAETNVALERTQARLANPGFTDKAPEAVVAGARQQAADLDDKRTKLATRLAELE